MRRSYILLFHALLFAHRCIGQDMIGDSLSDALEHATTDTARIRVLEHLSVHYLSDLGMLDSSEACIDRAFALHAKLPAAEANASRRLLMALHERKGFALHQRADQEGALREFQAGARLAEQLHMPEELAGMYVYMSNCFGQMADFQSAIAQTRKALAILEPMGPSSSLAFADMRMSRDLLNILQYDSAAYRAKKAASFYASDKDPFRQFAAEGVVLEILYFTRQHDSAQVYMRSHEKLAAVLTNPQVHMLLHARRGRLNAFLGNNKAAMADMDSAQVLASQLGIPFDDYETYRLRGIILAANQRTDEAFASFDSAEAKLTRSMGLDKQREMAETRMKFEQEEEKALADAALTTQRTQKWAAIIIGSLALLLAIVWYSSFRTKSRTAEELRLKNEEIHRTQAQLISSEKAREAEAVRTRIARDIHDDIGATLTKIALLSGVAARKTHDAAESARMFDRITEHTKTVSRALSDVVWAVDPQHDTHQGMVDHVRDLAQRLLGDNGIRCELDLHAQLPDAHIAPALKRDMNLVLNECFNNILKYAHAEVVTVKLDLRASTFDLRVDDDGIGFDPATVPDRGNGLRNMPARIAQHGGLLTITSAPGKGTALHAHGPLV